MSEGEILLSLETKGLLCVMISGWGGVRWGEGNGFWERERFYEERKWGGGGGAGGGNKQKKERPRWGDRVTEREDRPRKGGPQLWF